MGGRGGASHRSTAGHFGRDPMLQGFRTFSDSWDAYNWHEQNNFDFDRWRQLLTDAERSGIQMYTGQAYKLMNPALRENQAAAAYIQRAIDGAKAGLAKWETSDEFIAFRGANLHWTANLLGGTEAQLSDAGFLRSRIGKKVTDKGFMSSAVSKDAAWYAEVDYKIYVRKGVSGMYVEPITRSGGEYEFLFNSGTQFKIHEIITDASGRITSMTLEALPVKKRRR